MIKISYDYNSNILNVNQKVVKFIQKNLNFMKEKNMVKVVKKNNKKCYKLNIERILLVTIGLDFKNFEEKREQKYIFIKELIKNHKKFD